MLKKEMNKNNKKSIYLFIFLFRLLKRRLSSITPNRIGSSISQRANSELIKNFFQMRGSNTNTPMSIKSKKIAKLQPS